MPSITYCKNDSPADRYLLRDEYFTQLGEAQELFLEIQIRKGTLYEIKVNDSLAGYAIISTKNQLLEFHLSPAAVNAADMLFGLLIKKLSIKSAYIKSFDALSVACAANHHQKLSIEGYLYRHRSILKEYPLPKDIKPRPAVAKDRTSIAAINEEIFENIDEIDEYIQKKQIHLFFRKKKLMGFIIHARVIENRPEYDVGMLVAPPFRKQGYGAAFLSFAIDYVANQGGRPLMGCAADNIASQRTIEALGFISKYRMFEFTF